MKKLSSAIVDDDLISQAILERLIGDSGLFEPAIKFSSAADAIPWLMMNPVDLLFLDIEMPGMSGIEMLKSLLFKPNVIIVSSSPDYAIPAFDLAVVDYLIKPIRDYSRFLTAINKALINRRRPIENNQSEDNIFVKIDSLLLKLELDTILYIEAFGDYIKIHTVYSTLKKLEDKLDKGRFVRVHRSYVVNISKITNIDPNNLEINKRIIPISGTYKDELLSKIKVL